MHQAAHTLNRRHDGHVGGNLTLFSCTIEYLSDDVIKMNFLKLWDLPGYSERTMSKRPTCQK